MPTENTRTDFPFFTDDDFGPGKYDFVLDQDPWGADDDTDIEYVYQGTFSQENHSSIHGQYYVKIFEKYDLSAGSHTIRITGDESATEKTIDMLSIIGNP